MSELSPRWGLWRLREHAQLDVHWQYLLSNRGMVVHLQCPDCGHLWSADTRKREQRSSHAA